MSSASTNADRSMRLRTAYAVLDSYSALDVDALLGPTAANFTHQVLPLSLGMPVRSRDEFASHATRFVTIFKSFAMEPQAVFEDAEQNAVVAYCKMVGELNMGLGAWENECVIMMRMSEDGTAVVEHREFVDSVKAQLLPKKLAEVMGKTGQDIHGEGAGGKLG